MRPWFQAHARLASCPDRRGVLCLPGGRPQCAFVDGGHDVGAVGQQSHNVVQAHGLCEAQRREPCNGARGQAACGHEHESYEGVHHQYLAGEEACVEAADDEQRHQAAAEAQAEVGAAQSLVVVLHEEAEAEQQRENGVCLAAEGEEERVPHATVDYGEPSARAWVGKLIEIEVLD